VRDRPVSGAAESFPVPDRSVMQLATSALTYGRIGVIFPRSRQYRPHADAAPGQSMLRSSGRLKPVTRYEIRHFPAR
jgi:hypothetical protein